MEEAKYGIGVDIGGTKIAAGLVNLDNGELYNSEVIPTNRHRSSEEIIEDLKSLVEGQLKAALAAGQDVDLCGLAFPELVNNQGQIVSDWNFDLKHLREEDFPISRVLFDSDVRVAGLAEARLGAGKTFHSFVYISLGTGLSYSLFVDGKPWRGANGYAIHFASSPLSGQCPHCNELSTFVAEEQVSGSGLASSWQLATGEPYPGGVPAMLKAAQSADGPERAHIHAASQSLGGLVAQIVNMLDPDGIVIGGGLGVAGGIYQELTIKAIRERIWAEDCKSIPIQFAHFGNKAGIIGAALTPLDLNR